MRRLLSYLTSSLFILGIVSNSYAHPGHDHSSLQGNAVTMHLLEWGLVLALLGISIWMSYSFLRRYLHKHKNSS